MKHIKAPLFLIGILGSIFFNTSCGESQTEKEEETTESNVDENAIVLDYDDCLGDYVSLQSDVKGLFIAPVKDGRLVLGKTTKTEVISLFNEPDELIKKYEGLNLTCYFTYENNVLQSVAIDCFYECTGAKELLPVDQAAISHALSEALGSEGNGSSDNAQWILNEMVIRKSNFEDGYGIYIDQLH